MARSQIPVKQIVLTGVVVAGVSVTEVTADPTNGHYIDNADDVTVICRNTDVNPHHVYVPYANPPNGAAVSPHDVLIPGSTTIEFGVFDPSWFSQVPAADRRRVFINPDSSTLRLQARRS